MELLKLLGSLILVGFCIYLIFATIEDFKWRKTMTYAWLQLTAGVAFAILSGAGAYYLY